MKKSLIAFALTLSTFSAMAGTGYSSPDAAYAKPCVTEAKQKAATMLKTYAAMGGWDYDNMINDKVTFPAVSKNPAFPQQYLHPIEFTALVSRGVETRIQAVYASSSKTDPNLCVFMGIVFLDKTSAN